ncbi:MAG: hypothetical protein Q7T01_00425 [bacterium]|nr:hypothetical protein [bacterium]
MIPMSDSNPLFSGFGASASAHEDATLPRERRPHERKGREQRLPDDPERPNDPPDEQPLYG